MPYRFAQSRISVFAREPVLGQVKTRLNGELGAERVLALYQAMTRRIVTTVVDSRLADMDLWVSSNPSHEFFLTICNRKNIYPQMGSDLGERMGFTVRQTLASGDVDSVILVGSDCPAMNEAYLESALAALAGGKDVVIGPADDGGYVLIGIRHDVPELFDGIPWGTESVLSTTIDRIRSLRLNDHYLDMLWDVDRPQDLARLQQLQPPLEGI